MPKSRPGCTPTGCRGIYEDDAEPLYDGPDVDSAIIEVTRALYESELIPGLGVSIERYESDDESWAIIAIYDGALRHYRSIGTATGRLTDDWSATGWDGVLAIARALINVASDLS